MTVSMHENMLERQYQDRDNVPPPKIELCMKDSLPEEWKRRLRLLLKNTVFAPLAALAWDPELRRYCRTVAALRRPKYHR
jgi:hypothetical protein